MKTKILSILIVASSTIWLAVGQQQDIRKAASSGGGGGGGGGSTNVAWGGITGTLGSQSDLATALTNKVAKAGDTMTGALSFTGTNHAGLVLNSLTTTAKNALTPAAGMMVFDSTLGRFQSYDGAAWYSNVRTSGDTMTGTLAITPASNTSALTVSSFSLTGSNAQSLVDLAGTWNTSGNPTALKLNVTNTASGSSSQLMDLQIGGTTQFSVDKAGKIVAGSGIATKLTITPSTFSQQWEFLSADGGYALAFKENGIDVPFAIRGGAAYGAIAVNLFVPPTGRMAWSTASTVNNMSTYDLALERDAANTLALRNGSNAQTLNVYNSYTDASNYERLSISPTLIQREKAGTGANHDFYIKNAFDLNFYAGGALNLGGGSTSAGKWQISSSGHFIALTDNTYDIGASGANRPRDIFAGRNIYSSGGFLVTADNTYIGKNGGVYAYFNGLNTVSIRGSGAEILQFGGATASFPALKRNAAELQVRLADDSNYGTLGAPNNQAGYTHVCTSATSNAVFYVSVPTTNIVSGEVQWTVTATDGTDTQAQSGRTTFDAIAKSTAVTATTTSFTNSAAASAGTLTVLVTANTATNNVVALMVTPTTSLTTTNLVTKWRITTPLTYTVNTL